MVETPSGPGEFVPAHGDGFFTDELSKGDVEFKFSQLPLEDREEHLTEEEMVGDGSLYMYNGGLFFATYDKNGNFINNISIDR